jgi:hypothetical protein
VEKVTDKEIIKALECCITNKCDECAIYKECHNENGKGRVQVVLDLIKRQQAEIEWLKKIVEDYAKAEEEIERLQKENERFADIGKLYSAIKSEAIKEFAERLCKDRVSNDPVVIAVKTELKMTEGSNG